MFSKFENNSAIFGEIEKKLRTYYEGEYLQEYKATPKFLNDRIAYRVPQKNVEYIKDYFTALI